MDRRTIKDKVGGIGVPRGMFQFIRIGRAPKENSTERLDENIPRLSNEHHECSSFHHSFNENREELRIRQGTQHFLLRDISLLAD